MVAEALLKWILSKPDLNLFILKLDRDDLNNLQDKNLVRIEYNLFDLSRFSQSDQAVKTCA